MKDNKEMSKEALKETSEDKNQDREHGVQGHDHQGMLRKAKEELPTDELLCDLGDLFKVFGDTTRIKILYSLFETSLCVCAISELLGMNQSAISHQLKILKANRLVASRREGKTMIYRLADDHVRTMIGQGFEHLLEMQGGK